MVLVLVMVDHWDDINDNNTVWLFANAKVIVCTLVARLVTASLQM